MFTIVGESNKLVPKLFYGLLLEVKKVKKIILNISLMLALTCSITTINNAQQRLPRTDVAPSKTPQANNGGANNLNYSLGEEVLVSNNQDGGALRCEPSAAIFKDTVIVAWNDSYGGAHGSPTGVAVGWAISKDRGKTFKFGGYLPESQPAFLPSGADSWLAADAAGNFYLQVLSWQKSSHHIQLYYMDKSNLGKWRKMTDARTLDVSKGYLDKPAMAVDRDKRIGIVYTEEKEGSPIISFSLSSNRGQSWSKPFQVSASSKTQKTGASVSMRGNQIVVSWMEGGGLALNEVWYVMSKDGGRSFTAPSMIYRLKEPVQSPKGYALGVGPSAFISNNTWLTNAPAGNGNTTFYLTLAEGVGKGSRVLLFALTTDTNVWSKPVQIEAISSNPLSVFPSLSMAGKIPALLYYHRNDAANSEMDVYLSLLPKNKNFQNIKVNTVSTDWAKVSGDKQYAPIQRNFGDYITLASYNNVFVAAWTDGRQGVPRIYARVLEIKSK